MTKPISLVWYLPSVSHFTCWLSTFLCFYIRRDFYKQHRTECFIYLNTDILTGCSSTCLLLFLDPFLPFYYILSICSFPFNFFLSCLLFLFSFIFPFSYSIFFPSANLDVVLLRSPVLMVPIAILISILKRKKFISIITLFTTNAKTLE